MSRILRSARPDDLDRLVELNQQCYPLLPLSAEERRDLIYARNPRCSLDNVLVLLDRAEIIASMIAYRFTQYQENVEIPVVGIGSVAVAPDRRREGAAGELIQLALEQYEEEELPACILYPFSHHFYRRLGWGYAGEIRQYHLLTSQLRDCEEALDDEELRVKILTLDQLPLLMRFYDAQARRMNGLLQRGERYWRERLLTAPRIVAAAFSSGEMIGYLIYTLERCHSENIFIQEMLVHEWCAPAPEAREALLGFIARQSDQVGSIRLFLGPDEPLHLWIEDPRLASRAMMQRLYS
ncbi:MAG: GNAT family N-acetyltransferase, partial [bacterium]